MKAMHLFQNKNVLNLIICFVVGAYVAASQIILHQQHINIIDLEYDVKRVNWGEWEFQREVVRLYRLEDSLGIKDTCRMDSLMWYDGEVNLDRYIEEFSKYMITNEK